MRTRLVALAITLVVAASAVLLVRAHVRRGQDAAPRRRVQLGNAPGWDGKPAPLELVGTAPPTIRSLAARPDRKGVRVVAQVDDDDLASVYLQRRGALEPLAPLAAGSRGVFQVELPTAKEPRDYTLVALDRGGRKSTRELHIPASP